MSRLVLALDLGSETEGAVSALGLGWGKEAAVLALGWGKGMEAAVLELGWGWGKEAMAEEKLVGKQLRMNDMLADGQILEEWPVTWIVPCASICAFRNWGG